MRYLIALIALGSVLGCGANPYGYAPTYEALSDEEPYMERGIEQSYEEVRRDPSTHQSELLAWFGVVDDVKAVPGSNQVLVSMSLHFHQDRHLCTDQFDDSCRVTISEKTGGPFSALLVLNPDDKSGRDRLYGGSLVKVYGHVTPEYDERGGPIVKADYYRHWPRGNYVTTTRASNMRR
jgi:hypothetical protein